MYQPPPPKKKKNTPGESNETIVVVRISILHLYFWDDISIQYFEHDDC